jgi:hypothetical protein
MSEEFRKLGRVVITQVQPEGLKFTVQGFKRYDPSHRVEVPRIYLNPHGVEGETAAGERLLDIHHVRHPNSHNKGSNAVSIGFTTHYEVMRDRFGEHMQDGTGGENIIIDSDQEIWLPDLGSKIEFRNPANGDTVSLDVIKIAAPCDPFSHFAANSQDQRLPADELKDTLQFLGDGRRGFLLTLGADQETGLVQPGDIVYSIS